MLQGSGSVSLRPILGWPPLLEKGAHVGPHCDMHQVSTDYGATESEYCVWSGGARLGRVTGTKDQFGN